MIWPKWSRSKQNTPQVNSGFNSTSFVFKQANSQQTCFDENNQGSNPAQVEPNNRNVTAFFTSATWWDHHALWMSSKIFNCRNIWKIVDSNYFGSLLFVSYKMPNGFRICKHPIENPRVGNCAEMHCSKVNCCYVEIIWKEICFKPDLLCRCR